MFDLQVSKIKQLEVIKTDNLTGAMYHIKLIKEGSVDSWDSSAGADCQPAAGERDVHLCKQNRKRKHRKHQNIHHRI